MSRRILVSLAAAFLAATLWIAVGSCRSSGAGGSREAPRTDRPTPGSAAGPSNASASASKPTPGEVQEHPGEPAWTIDEMLAHARKLTKNDAMALLMPHGGGGDGRISRDLEDWISWTETHEAGLTDVEIEKIALAYVTADIDTSAALSELLVSAIRDRDEAEYKRRGGKTARLDREGWSRLALSGEGQAQLMKVLQGWGIWTKSETDWEDRDYSDNWTDYIRGMRKEVVTEMLARSGYAPVGAWLTEHPERLKQWNLGGSLVVPELIRRAKYETDPATRAGAREVLAAIRDPEAAGLLTPLLRDEDHELRRTALQALMREQAQVPTADLVLFLQEAASDQERAEAIKSLGDSGNAAIGPMLLDTAKERVEKLRRAHPKAGLRDDPVLWESCESLARMRDPGAIDWWMQAILQPGSTTLDSGPAGRDTLRIIMWFGQSKADKSKPLLDGILRDPHQSESLRLGAQTSLQMITGDMTYGADVKIESER